MAMNEPTGGAVLCADESIGSVGGCGELIERDWARWVCSCGATVHYACLPGGVPVRDAAQLVHVCGGRWECHWHADENQGQLFR